jgi:hypothetical protein
MQCWIVQKKNKNKINTSKGSGAGDRQTNILFTQDFLFLLSHVSGMTKWGHCEGDACTRFTPPLK